MSRKQKKDNVLRYLKKDPFYLYFDFVYSNKNNNVEGN